MFSSRLSCHAKSCFGLLCCAELDCISGDPSIHRSMIVDRQPSTNEPFFWLLLLLMLLLLHYGVDLDQEGFSTVHGGEKPSRTFAARLKDRSILKTEQQRTANARCLLFASFSFLRFPLIHTPMVKSKKDHSI